eukprot:1736479-Rhodomonas_salina.3
MPYATPCAVLTRYALLYLPTPYSPTRAVQADARRAVPGFVGWSDDNDCKVNGQWQGHSYLEPVANPSTGFKAGDKVGIELDTDNGTLSWTKNGRLYVKYSRPVEKRAKYFMVSANNTSDLEVGVGPAVLVTCSCRVLHGIAGRRVVVCGAKGYQATGYVVLRYKSP